MAKIETQEWTGKLHLGKFEARVYTGASNVTATCKLTPLPGNAKKEREDKREQKKAAEKEKQAEAWSGEYTKIESKALERYSHDAACSAGGEKRG